MPREASKDGPAEDRYDGLDATTRKARSTAKQIAEQGAPGFTVLWHPDTDRVGEEAMLAGLLSRLDPYFAQPTGGKKRPLSDPYLSREPLAFELDADGGVRLDPAGSGTRLVIDGTEVTAPRRFDRIRLEHGVVILLADRIVLLLHLQLPSGQRLPSYDLVGESAAMLDLRREIQRLSGLAIPVLLRGESGTGKELVARAIHRFGRRHSMPFVAVNVAAIPKDLAEAELFGAAKGAHSGADRERRGHFELAQGGTLFLDEIGDASAEIQVKLLRALEEGEIRPLGTSKARKIDVRLISATDADLESAMTSDRFRGSLFHRLSGYEIEIPALRARREDIGRLFFHFLRRALEEVGEAWRLELHQPDDEPWVPADLVARLACHAWPGNVRELRNFAQQMAVFSHGEDRMRLPDKIERLLCQDPAPSPGADESADTKAETLYRHPDEISDDELVAALRACRWNKRQTAAALNVSETSLDSLMKRSKRVRRARDLSRKEIENALRRRDKDMDAAADDLEVSKRALLLRMRALGMKTKP